MYDLGMFVGALVPTFLVSRLFLWLMKKWDGGVLRLLAVHSMSLLVAVLLGGFGFADENGFAAMYALGNYAAPQVIWLAVDFFCLNGAKKQAGEQNGKHSQ